MAYQYFNRLEARGQQIDITLQIKYGLDMSHSEKLEVSTRHGRYRDLSALKKSNPEEPHFREHIAWWRRSRNGRLLVAQAADLEIVGSVMFQKDHYWIDRGFFVRGLFVDPAVRQQGVGAELMTGLESYLLDFHSLTHPDIPNHVYVPLYSSHAADNGISRALHDRLGYEVLAEGVKILDQPELETLRGKLLIREVPNEP